MRSYVLLVYDYEATELTSDTHIPCINHHLNITQLSFYPRSIHIRLPKHQITLSSPILPLFQANPIPPIQLFHPNLPNPPPGDFET